MLSKEIPFLRIVIPLCLGVVSGLIIIPPVWVIAASLGICSLLLLAGMPGRNSEENRLFGGALFLALFITGNFLYTSERKYLSELEPGENLYLCTLSQYPEQRERSIRFLAELEFLVREDTLIRLRGSLLVYGNRNMTLKNGKPGDRYLIKCNPEEIRERGNPHEFNYRLYMEHRQTRYYTFIDSTGIVAHAVPESRSIADRALITRERIIEMFRERGVSDAYLGTVSAVTLGEKRMLEPGQKENFIAAGVMHIMAVSGLHAVILSMIVMNCLFFLKRRFNIARIIAALVVLWAFAFVTGLTPSVLRATLMFTFVSAGKMLKRPVNTINSVLASAFVLILLQPSVIFDAGFLLSYAAVIFIICFYTRLCSLLSPGNIVTEKLWQMAAVSLTAQAGTFPLTVMMFNRFPLYFLAANILIVPLSTLMIILAGIIPLTYPLVKISSACGWLLNQVTGLTGNLTGLVAGLPGASLGNIGMTTAECVLLEIALFAALQFFLNRPRSSPAFMLAAFLAFMIWDSVSAVHTKSTNELVVYNSANGFQAGIRAGKVLNLYSSSDSLAPEINRHVSTAGLDLKVHEINSEDRLLKAGNTIILIAGSGQIKEVHEIHPGIVILPGGGSSAALKWRKALPDALVVSAARLPGRETGRMGTIEPVNMYFTSVSGAFITSLDDNVK